MTNAESSAQPLWRTRLESITSSRWWRSPWLIVALFAVSRAWAVAAALGHMGYPAGHLVINDVTLYSSWAQALGNGMFPTHDPMWQYPPLAGPLFVLGSLLPPDPSAGFLLLAFLVDAATLTALIVAGRRTNRIAGAWLWAAAAFLVGPVFLTRFDVFPTALVVMGLLLVASRPGWAGALLGLGAALKVWPLLALAAVARPKLPRALTTFALVAASASLGVAAAYGGQAWSFLSGQSERGLQVESVAALPFVIAHALGADVPTMFRFGSMELDVQGAGLAALVATGVGALVLAWLAVARLLGRLESVPGADVALATVAVSVVASRVFSPQYSVWLIGIGAACLAARKTMMRTPIALICLAAVVTQPIYPPMYSGLINGEPLPTLLQTLRILLVVAATTFAVVRVLARQSEDAAASSSPRAVSGSPPASNVVSRSEIIGQRQVDSIH